MSRTPARETDSHDPPSSPESPPGASTQPIVPVPEVRHLSATQAAKSLFAYAEREIDDDPTRRAGQEEEEIALILRARGEIGALREASKRTGQRLTIARSVGEMFGSPALLSGHIRYLPSPLDEEELVVLGDLHGCYNTLKACLLQTGLIARLVADAPIHLACVGDYVDRGTRNFEVLRLLLALFVNFPERVTLCRGNHDDLQLDNGEVRPTVRPADWLEFWHLDDPHYFSATLFRMYKVLFDELPCTLLVGDGVAVLHGGPPPPRDFGRVEHLADLDQEDLCWQMRWARAELHRTTSINIAAGDSPSFGLEDIGGFMEALGLHTLVTGHDVVRSGAKRVSLPGPPQGPDLEFWTLCSMGGKDNPHDGGTYDDLTPKMLRRTGTGAFVAEELDWRAVTPPEELSNS